MPLRLWAAAMMNLPMKPELRKYPRYSPKQDSIQIFTFNQKTAGWLVDISETGLSFEYIPIANISTPVNTIDIYSIAGRGFFIPNIKGKKLYDKMIESTFYMPADFRRCGLKFIRLSEIQQHYIQKIINKFKYSY